MAHADALTGFGTGAPLALALLPGVGLALAWYGGSHTIETSDPIAVVAELDALAPRWVWWTARETAAQLVDAGFRPRACWDLGAVGRLLHGLSRDDPGAVWAAGHDLPEPPYAATSPAVAALLVWRKAERVATTYGWSWIDRDIGPDDRLRGVWGASEGAGRMTASAGLHNLPAELRPAVRPRPGRVLVRADLGQIEPRVLAAVSGDSALAAAAREDDMYAPVAKALGSDRPTAKVAVLAAMYGQTSGPAGAALKDMDRTYASAMAFLRSAEDCGRRGVDLRTHGGRLLRLSGLRDVLESAGSESSTAHSYGRFARNAVVQGAAAELFKAWAATVRAGLTNIDARIVLCLHDELLIETRLEDASRVVDVVDSSLQSAGSWWCAGSGVRLVTDTSVVESWADVR